MPARRGSTASSAADQQEESGSALTIEQSLRAGPFFIWALLQVLAIGVAASRFSLAAQYPIIGEFHAARVLLAVQLPAAAMLMPVLLSNWRSTLVAAALGALMQLTASLLTDVAPDRALSPIIYIMIWIAAQGLVPWSLRGSTMRLTTAAGVIGAFIAGAPLLVYLGVDLSSHTLDENVAGPMLLLLRHWPTVPLAAWGWLVGFIGLMILNRLFFQRISLRRVVATK